MINGPGIGQYDYGLGIDPEIISYIKESVEINSRISPVRCYLLFQNPTGSQIGTPISPRSIITWNETYPNCRAFIWSSGSNHPDLRPYTNNGRGSITVLIDNKVAKRVLEIEDLKRDDEFVVIKRKDLDNGPVELVFNTGFDAKSHSIDYYYTTMQPGIDPIRMKSDEDITKTFFGWTQYINNSSDNYRDMHQILIRMPLTTRDLIINEEGLVTLEENDSWTIWEPFVHDFDILIVPENQSITGKEERYEIVNKKDSIIQGVLITQRFKLRYIEPTDARYAIPYVTTYVSGSVESQYLIYDRGENIYFNRKV